jgi:hypothetical protein
MKGRGCCEEEKDSSRGLLRSKEDGLVCHAVQRNRNYASFISREVGQKKTWEALTK